MSQYYTPKTKLTPKLAEEIRALNPEAKENTILSERLVKDMLKNR